MSPAAFSGRNWTARGAQYAARPRCAAPKTGKRGADGPGGPSLPPDGRAFPGRDIALRCHRPRSAAGGTDRPARAARPQTASRRPRTRTCGRTPRLGSPKRPRDGGRSVPTEDRPTNASGHHALDHVAENVGEAEIAAVVTVGELFVVEAEQAQDRRVEV